MHPPSENDTVPVALAGLSQAYDFENLVRQSALLAQVDSAVQCDGRAALSMPLAILLIRSIAALTRAWMICMRANMIW